MYFVFECFTLVGSQPRANTDDAQTFAYAETFFKWEHTGMRKSTLHPIAARGLPLVS